jgi:RNA-directed DNA polymerase
LTRYADDWVVTCKSAAEARAAIDAAGRILKQLDVELHPQKTRIVHVRYGFEFLGYKIKRGKGLYLPANKIRSRARSGGLYAYPREKSIRRFKDQVRQRTKRRVPLATEQLIEGLNPLLRGWGEYYKRAHVRKLFNQLDRWIVRRIWSHRFKRWRNCAWKQLPTATPVGKSSSAERASAPAPEKPRTPVPTIIYTGNETRLKTPTYRIVVLSEPSVLPGMPDSTSHLTP